MGGILPWHAPALHMARRLCSPALLPQTARLISDRDLQLLRRFDKKDPAYQAKLLEEVRLLTCCQVCSSYRFSKLRGKQGKGSTTRPSCWRRCACCAARALLAS